MQMTIDMPNLIDVPMETAQKLHALQFMGYELMNLIYTFRHIQRHDGDETLIAIWLRESEEHLDEVNARIDKIQNEILEIHNAKNN